MPRSPATFRQSDVARAVKAARAAGLDVVGLEIVPDGTIRIIAGSGDPGDSLSPLEKRRLRRAGEPEGRA